MSYLQIPFQEKETGYKVPDFVYDSDVPNPIRRILDQIDLLGCSSYSSAACVPLSWRESWMYYVDLMESDREGVISQAVSNSELFILTDWLETFGDFKTKL